MQGSGNEIYTLFSLNLNRFKSNLAKSKSFLPKPALLRLYYALVHSHLLYCVAICGSTFPSYLNKLASLHNKAVKLVAGGKYQDHVTPFYSQLNVLKLSNLVKHKIAKIVHHHLHFHFPHYYLHKSPEQSTPRAALFH